MMHCPKHGYDSFAAWPQKDIAAGVVRMSLGDNTELGGQVRGDFYPWFFFPGAGVEVNGQPLTARANLPMPFSPETVDHNERRC